MSFERIGILSIGEMGYHWARVLGGHGVKVFSCVDGRSAATRERARSIGVELAPTLVELVSQVDLMVSIVVPSAAVETSGSSLDTRSSISTATPRAATTSVATPIRHR